MITNTACRTEIIPDRSESDRTGIKIIVTPISKENPNHQKFREDISATLEYVSIFDLQSNDESTPLHSEYVHKIKAKFLVNTEVEHLYDDVELFNPIEDVNDQRITLLARKYADSEMSQEDSARLKILTQRFRNIMPAITEKDIEIMESFTEQLERGRKLSTRLKEKYSLKR